MSQTLLDPRMFDTSQALGAHDGSALTGLPADFVTIASQDASSSSSIDFTSSHFDNSTYNTYLFMFEGLRPTTDAVYLYIRTSTDGGSTFDTSGYSYNAATVNEAGAFSGNGSGSASQINPINSNFGTATNEVGSGHVFLYNPGNTLYTSLTVLSSHNNATSNNFANYAHGMRESAADVDGLRFYFSSGSISVGKFTMYGMKG